MTAFWDAVRQDVTEASNLDDASFLEEVIQIETRIIGVVSLVTGDREFPNDLREKIQGVIATNSIDFARFIWERRHLAPAVAARDMQVLPPNERAIRWLKTMRYSVMLEELHALFHIVGERRHPNRFDTFFTDDPSSFVRARTAALPS